MDDIELNDFDYLPGIDLYLWFRLVVGVVAVAVLCTLAALLIG
ncbi:MAG: hypothetical protein JWM02_1172 [Frankiales bacterium]|nr:hypothetical protein [Frankiales bacterium]